MATAALERYLNTCSGSAYNTYRAWRKFVGPLSEYLPTGILRDGYRNLKKKLGNKWRKFWDSRKPKFIPVPFPGYPPLEYTEASTQVYLKGAICSVCTVIFLMGMIMVELAVQLDNDKANELAMAFWNQVFKRDYPDTLTKNLRDSKMIQMAINVLTRVVYLIGAFIRISALVGVCVVYFNFRCITQVYTIFVLAVAAALGTMIALTQRVINEIEPYLYSTLKTYDGWNSSNPASVFWNIMHMTFNCCGVDGFRDFLDLETWPKNLSNPDNLLTPISCCMTVNISNVSCAQDGGNATIYNNWFDLGCFPYIKDYLETHWVISYIPGILFVPYAILFIGMMMLLVISDYDLHAKKDA